MTSSVPAYVFAAYRLVPSTRQLWWGDALVKLGGRAFDLLLSLVERRNRTVAKDELMDLVWPTVVVEENNLQVQIVALRKLLGHPAIATVPGRGYRFTLPVTAQGGDDLPSPPPAPSEPSDAHRGNLPSTAPTLFGRAEDLQSLQAMMALHGLVTVVGTAGIGKTRLAQAAAHSTAVQDGVWWIDLAPLAESSLVPGTVALALGVNAVSGGDSTSAVLTALRDRAPLLVLDNAEHILDGVATFVLRLREAVPRVRLLVTSQEALHVEGEHVFRPEPLSLPDGDDPQRIALSGAVSLFVARAKEADRRFGLCDANQGAVADICRRLDGIPLAIELAAARIGLLGVDGLRDRLDQRFHLLTGGKRTSLRRHQTLRAALEWSHHLLGADEKTVLRRLAVFAGGFSLEAAQQVAEDSGIDCWDVLEQLGALVDKSLVVAEGGAVPRYRMLETTRLFALERLIDSGEADAVRRRHRDHFLEVAEACHRELLFGDTRRHLARLDRERDNLLLALAWSPGEEDAIAGLRLAAAMHHYWHLRAAPVLGIQVTRVALERPGAAVRSLERCRALVTAGWMCTLAGHDTEAVQYMNEALALARALADPTTLCFALAKFAHVRHHRNETDDALRLATEAVAVGHTLGDSIELSDALVLRAHVHRRVGDRLSARSLFGEALELRTRLNMPSGLFSVHLNLAFMAVEDDLARDAQSQLVAALALLERADSRTAGLHLVAVTAQWAAIAGLHEASVRLEAACDRLLDRSCMRNELEPSEAARLERSRCALGATACAAIEAAGRALSYEQALQAAADGLSGAPL